MREKWVDREMSHEEWAWETGDWNIEQWNYFLDSGEEISRPKIIRNRNWEDAFGGLPVGMFTAGLGYASLGIIDSLNHDFNRGASSIALGGLLIYFSMLLTEIRRIKIEKTS